MNKSIFIIAVSLLFAVGTAVGRPAPDKKTRYIVLAEQARHYVAIADAATQRIVWTWDVSKSGLPAEHRNWFNCPTEIKPVYGGLCILVVSNGGIGLIRIADHRMIWYAASGGGFPHSAEVLPDGNIAVACSTSNTPAGDKLKIYRVDYDRFPATEAVAVYPLKSGHNVVWDRKNKVLWATAYTTLNAYAYGLKEGVPALTLCESLPLPDGGADPHDLFPAYGERKLWLTTSERLYKFDPKRKRFDEVVVAEELRRALPAIRPSCCGRPNNGGPMRWSPSTELPYTRAPNISRFTKADGCWTIRSVIRKIIGFRQNDNRNIRIE